MVWGLSVGLVADLTKVLRPLVEAAGYQWWGLEYVQENRMRILRLYIDAEAGILVDDCALVSNQISPVLDVENLIQQEYHLEVSSPGLQRPLFDALQCEAYLGHTLKVWCARPLARKRRFTGVLQAVEGRCLVLLRRDAVELKVPFDVIDKVCLWP